VSWLLCSIMPLASSCQVSHDSLFLSSLSTFPHLGVLSQLLAKFIWLFKTLVGLLVSYFTLIILCMSVGNPWLRHSSHTQHLPSLPRSVHARPAPPRGGPPPCSNRRQQVQWAGVFDEHHPKRSFVRSFIPNCRRFYHIVKTQNVVLDKHHVCFYI
jgi:hypothetical protein